MHLSQTLDSAWCRHEVDEARAYGIPIICIVDIDRQLQREVIDCWMEKGFGWLFEAQVSCSSLSTGIDTICNNWKTFEVNQ